ncbi:hypothetical protein DM01DRAFT_330135 [Hesseltinella vesiculosa]|uniref:Uncharacterized protein n=1 Tax=Hesseltinella vesiculosa TaxID=101127 RepID=A0A1X2GF59_9FUNG|nr:hypothetical protein DM01DRAFT_330135 [Hesseltinella vesiculosa]
MTAMLPAMPPSLPDMEHDDSSCSDTETVLCTPTTGSWDPTLTYRPSPLKKKHQSAEWPRPSINKPTHDDGLALKYQQAVDRMAVQIDQFLRQHAQRHASALKKRHGVTSSMDGWPALDTIFPPCDTHMCDLADDTLPSAYHDLPTWLGDSRLPSRQSQRLHPPSPVDKKNTRLILSLQKLARKHNQTKRQWKHQLHQTRQLADQDRRQWQARYRAEVSAKTEAEEVVECMRLEMEHMMDELQHLKQKQHVVNDDGQTSDRPDVAALEAKLAMAEKRAAENDLRVAVLEQRLKKQVQLQQQIATPGPSPSPSDADAALVDEPALPDAAENASDPTPDDHDDHSDSSMPTNPPSDDVSVIQALEQAIRDRDLELAKRRDQEEKKQKAWQQERQVERQTLAKEKAAWQDHLGQELDKAKQIWLVQSSRDMRTLEGDKAELEAHVDRLEGLVAFHEAQWHELHVTCKRSEQQYIHQQVQFERADKAAKETIVNLEQRIIGLEAETVKLYGKNLKFANQLIAYD